MLNLWDRKPCGRAVCTTCPTDDYATDPDPLRCNNKYCNILQTWILTFAYKDRVRQNDKMCGKSAWEE